jgi:hypothetical protein
MNHDNKDSLVNLNLMEDELVVRLSSHLKGLGSSSPESSKEASSGRKRGCGRGRGHGHGHRGGG